MARLAPVARSSTGLLSHHTAAVILGQHLATASRVVPRGTLSDRLRRFSVTAWVPEAIGHDGPDRVHTTVQQLES
ncbi:hypothetical protein PC116_g1382 [Phytophthora cactorum]|nr:hypothetical protein PC116_g1382 [Phytophthora cactorum]